MKIFYIGICERLKVVAVGLIFIFLGFLSPNLAIEMMQNAFDRANKKKSLDEN